MLREEPDLAGLGRLQFELQPVDLDRPRLGHVRLATPATIAVEAQVGRAPRLRVATGAEGSRVRPVGDPRAEPFESGAAAHVEERIAVVHLRAPGRAAPVDRDSAAVPDSAGP